jgi:hypothetical protein
MSEVLTLLSVAWPPCQQESDYAYLEAVSFSKCQLGTLLSSNKHTSPLAPPRTPGSPVIDIYSNRYQSYPRATRHQTDTVDHIRALIPTGTAI